MAACGSVRAKEHVLIYVDESRVGRISQSNLPDGQNIQTVKGDNVSDQCNMRNERPNIDMLNTQSAIARDTLFRIRKLRWIWKSRRATSTGRKQQR